MKLLNLIKVSENNDVQDINGVELEPLVSSLNPNAAEVSMVVVFTSRQCSSDQRIVTRATKEVRQASTLYFSH